MPTIRLTSRVLERFQEMCISVATDGQGDEDPEQYQAVRAAMLVDPRISGVAPEFVRKCRTLQQVRPFMQNQSGSWQPRRTYIWEALTPVFDILDTEAEPVDTIVIDGVGALNSAHVRACWDKALARRDSDPEGAVTAARTFLESTMKTILDDLGLDYGQADDLPKLYHRVSEALVLSPSKHAEEPVRRILGGCTSVVEGIASFRNRAGDAHGQGRRSVRPAERHAGLTVNLAGAMALFLVQTWEARHFAPGNEGNR